MTKKLIALFLFALLLLAATAAAQAAQPSIVIAYNPLFGSLVFRDMATARQIAPVVARALAMQNCGEDPGCYALADLTRYETVPLPATSRAWQTSTRK